MTIRYILTGAGWSECHIEIGGERAHITASYLWDALDSLCAAVIELFGREKSTTARFAEEPGEFRWRFHRITPHHIRVRILWFRDFRTKRDDSEGEIIFDATCRLRAFAEALLAELQRILAEHGEPEYRRLWMEHPFPQQRIDQLQERLAWWVGPRSPGDTFPSGKNGR